MTDKPATGSGPATDTRPRLRDALTGSGGPVVVAELVPWAGALDDPAGERARRLAAELEADPRITALSITDNAGGHARLSPEVLAAELVSRGRRVIVHVTCRDRNRNELLSLGWRLCSAGIEDLLVLTGDYPSSGYLGVAKPVFDIDSVSLLHLYDRLNKGIGGTVVARPIARDGDRDIEDLGPARNAGTPDQTDFFLGAAVNPYKIVERDQVPQFLKLENKVRNGARYAITQVGWDMRKLGELTSWVADRDVPVTLMASVMVLTRTTARIVASGEVPGVAIPMDLLNRIEREAASPDKGKAFFGDLAARQIAIARGLGYAGIYLGGPTRAEDFFAILEKAAEYGRQDWHALVASTTYTMPGTWYAYDQDHQTSLSSSQPVSLTHKGGGLLGGPGLAYRFNRAVHGLVFDTESAPLAPLARGLFRGIERAHLGGAFHVLEQAVKIPLYDCRDCGDCSLPDIAYLCPESQCVKNQRNGPCGGSNAGECEIPGKACIWARAYGRLAPYGESVTMLERPVVICDNALRRTSAWNNTFLGRDHATRPPIHPADGGER
ncbi:MAG: methylenetetrahydrofolate reductase C-terminal domain-containing protein [Candidatus Limnocylindrales bacterium]